MRKRATVIAIEFGEKLLWKVRQKNRLDKLNPRWEKGVYERRGLGGNQRGSAGSEVGEENPCGRVVE